MTNQAKSEAYEAPRLTVYGSVQAITGNQNSKGSDVPLGPTTPVPDNYYSVGK